MTAPAAGTPRITWPPPALEPIHGKLWPVIAVLALADIVLVPPLLLSLGAHQPIGSLGPFGDAFWVPLAASFLGSLVLTGGLVRLSRLFRGARTAAQAGHAWRTILLAVADEPRDTGFLLTGSRAFASLGATERATILSTRSLSAYLSLSAVLIMPAALALSIVLGRSRAVGPGFLWTTTLWVPLILWLGGALSGGGAKLLAASARRKKPGAEPAAPVSEWNAALQDLAPGGARFVDRPARPGVYRALSVTTILLALLVVIPVAVAVVSGTIGSILASIATPSFGNTRARFAAAQALRRFALEVDPAITPEAAGEALHALISTGRPDAQREAPERQPVRLYPEPWSPMGETGPALPGVAWLDSLFAGRRLTARETALLREIARHPAHAEFATVARAGAMDVIGTRLDLPFGPGVTMVSLPIPRFSNIREGARAHIAVGLLDLMNGRPARAEQAIREVISVGFRMIDHGPTLIDNLIGVALVDLGGDALEGFYRYTGRARDAETLEWIRSETRRAAERAVAGEARWTAEAGLRAMPQIVLDSTQALGLRWEFFGWTSVFAPCANIKTIVFGPGEDYAEWLASARQGLVRRPADEALMELMLRGPFGTGRCLGLWGGIRTIGRMR